MRRFLIAVGGTGGHLFPAQALAKELSSENILFAGHNLSKNPFFEKTKLPFRDISAGSLKKGLFRKNFYGLYQALRLIKSFQPDVVIGFGSFHTFPILLAAWICRKKIVLFESNTTLGRVNRLFLPLAKVLASQFPFPTKKGKLVPFLPWEKKEGTKEEALSYFQLDPHRLTFLLFAGSQGARFFNEQLPPILDVLFAKWGNFQVLHFTGNGSAQYKKAPAVVKPFETKMHLAYCAASLAISRAGANAIGEIITYQVPTLFIPFPFASEDHQRKNAEKVEGTRFLLEKDCNLENIERELKNLLENREVYQRMLGAQLSKRERRESFAEIVKGV